MKNSSKAERRAKANETKCFASNFNDGKNEKLFFLPFSDSPVFFPSKPRLGSFIAFRMENALPMLLMGKTQFVLRRKLLRCRSGVIIPRKKEEKKVVNLESMNFLLVCNSSKMLIKNEFHRSSHPKVRCSLQPASCDT